MNETTSLARPLLLVDDEPLILRGLRVALTRAGFRDVRTLQDSREVLDVLEGTEIGAMVLDLQMPHVSGTEVLSWMARNRPQVPVVILTASSGIDKAVECMRLGAFDYHVKPVEIKRLIGSLRKALEIRNLRGELTMLRHHLLSGAAEDRDTPGFDAVSERMIAILRYAQVAARTDEPILICGETGVGKKRLARTIHELSGRPGRFVDLDVSGMDDVAFGRTVFGEGGPSLPEEKISGTPILEAESGTLSLRGVDALGDGAQRRLLLLIEERAYHRDGEYGSPAPADVRLILSASDITAAVESGVFRRDLLFRLQTHLIEVPPLRERPEDIPFLLNALVETGSSALGMKKPPIPATLIGMLMRHPLRGNIHELKEMVREALQGSDSGALSLDPFMDRQGSSTQGTDISGAVSSGPSDPDAFPIVSIFGHFPTIEEASDYLIDEAMKVTGGNKKAAAALLQITRQTVNRRIKLRK